MRAATLAFVVFAAAATMPAQEHDASRPLTAAERSGWTRTATHGEVLAFLDAVAALPHGDRLQRSSLGDSSQGRPLAFVIAAAPPLADAAAVRASGKLRVLVNANIHAGEVEGKEAVQMLLREIAHGEHTDLLEHAVLMFVPDFNPDGNDRIDVTNRPDQNGPDGGVGERANGGGLDLNRDFVKVESPEVRALLGAFVRFDPHLFFDLHTTDGSYHGYHLTYAPSLSTSADADLDQFTRVTLIGEVRHALQQQGWRTFDYGNFTDGEPREWVTYEPLPRFGTNYYALRNRIALLSEAYSHLDYERRVRVTAAFVLESVRTAVRHRAAIERLCAAADRRARRGALLGTASELGPAQDAEVLVGSVQRHELPGVGVRLVADAEFEPTRMPVRVAFRATAQIALPTAWAIVGAGDAVRDNLLAHGIVVERLTEALTIDGEVFATTEVCRAERPFQGHRLLSLRGELRRQQVVLPAGTLLVRAEQPLGMLAAQLLEAQSEDALVTWGFFDAALAAVDATGSAAPSYPVVRLHDVAGLATASVTGK